MVVPTPKAALSDPCSDNVVGHGFLGASHLMLEEVEDMGLKCVPKNAGQNVSPAPPKWTCRMF